MTERSVRFECPMLLRKLGLLSAIAALGWVAVACGDVNNTSTNCDGGNVIALSEDTDEISEMKERGVAILEVAECSSVIDLELLDGLIEQRLSTRVTDNLVLGRRALPSPKVDLSIGLRYLPISELPIEYEVVIVEDQALAVVPVQVEGVTTEGLSYTGESFLVLGDLIQSLNASIRAIEPRGDAQAFSGSGTDALKDRKRGNKDALLFALGATTVILGGLFGVSYFGGSNENNPVSSTRKRVNKTTSKLRKSGTNGLDSAYFDYDHNTSNVSVDGPYKAGDVVVVGGGIPWSHLQHYRNQAIANASSINGVLGQVAFTNSDFEARARDAVVMAEQLSQDYQSMWNDIGQGLSVTLTQDAADRLNVSIADQYSSPPPTIGELENWIGVRVIQEKIESQAQIVDDMARAVRSAGKSTLDHISFVAGERQQVGQSITNVTNNSSQIQKDYKRIDDAHARADRYHKSIPPDKVE